MKNISVKLVVLAITLTLITTALVSGTLAKYTKDVSATDNVRVAKFKFDLKEDGSTIANESTTQTQTLHLFTINDTGLSGNGNGVIIAPGTTKSFTLAVDNQSEVKVTVSFNLQESNAGHVPIYYTYGVQRYSAVLNGGHYVDPINGAGTYKSLDDLEIAMKKNIAVGAPVEPYNLSWTWDFNHTGDGQDDTSDTNLGITGTDMVDLTVTATVEQADA